MRDARLRVLLLTLPLLLHAACQDDAAKIQEHLARGDEHAKEGRLAEAQIEFRSALQIDPNDGTAHYKLAHAYLRGRKIKEGFWELRETVRLDAANHPAKLEFAQLAILAGEHEEALKQAGLVIEADPSNIAAYLMQGQALDQLKRGDEALGSYRKGLEVGPKDPGALRALAHALGARSEHDEAEELWKRIVELEPGFRAWTAYAGFLRRYHRRDRLADTEAALHKALELATEKEQPAAYAQLANLYFTTRREDQAVELLRQGIDATPDPVDLIYILARLERIRGNEADADALVERATRERPEDPKVYLVLASYRTRNGDRAAGLEAAEKAVALDPTSSEALLRKAEILVEMGYRDERETGVQEGMQIVADVLAREPSNPDALFVEAKIAITRNQVVEAITSVRAALDARPDWAEARYVLGAALAARKEFTSARTELGRALDLDPSLAEANQVLAQVHHRLGEHEYAVEVGRRYLRQRPDETKIRLLVAQSLVNLDRLDEALAELDSVPAEKRSPEVDYALGRIYSGKGQRERAREHLLAADKAMPHNSEVLENLLELDRREQQLAKQKGVAPARMAELDAYMAETLARVHAAVEAKPDDPRVRQVEGIAAVIEERLADAEAAFRKAIELDPTERSAYERLGRFYAATGRTEKTVEVYEKALEVRPDDSGFHHYLGMLYELRGDSDRAVARYEDAIRLAPDLAEAKNNLAYIYAEQGKNLDRALDLAQDAKTLLPDNPSVSDTLGWVLYKRGVPAAAISYLKEAEAATKQGDASLGAVRHHLALAYQANGDTAEAIAALDRSLAAVEAQSAAIRKQGGEPGPEPAWVSEARSLREKLAGEQQSAAAGG
jgi:tetratricopeptide (TPR) repeat protein